MRRLTANMPAGRLTPNSGLGTVARQVAANLEAVKALSDDYLTALAASVADRATLHTQLDGITTRLAWLEAHQPRSAPPVAVPAVTTVVGSQAVDVTLTWTTPWPDVAYSAEAILDAPASLLGKTSVAIKSKTVAGCVVTVTTGAVIAAGTASVRAISVTA